MNKIVIIDYGMGNLRSVFNKFKKIGVDIIVSGKKDEIIKANKLVLPGVGHFKTGMDHLKNLDLIDVLNKKVLIDKTPILGICLGVQLFTKNSDEGNSEGLGWIDAKTIKFKINDKIKYKIPHIGWSSVTINNTNRLNEGIKEDDLFYFVHSYHLKSNQPSEVWMTSHYESDFISAVRKDNIFGTQFHPEKSHDAGFKILKNFSLL